MTKVSSQALSEIVGVSLPTIRSMRGRGMPHTFKPGDQKHPVFDTAVCIAWMIAEQVDKVTAKYRRAKAEVPENDIDKAEAERRKAVAEARIKRLEADHKDAALVEVSVVESVWSEAFSAARVALLDLPGKMAPVLANETSAVEVERFVNENIDRVLRDLARSGGDASGVAAFDPSAASDDKRVGRRAQGSASGDGGGAGQVDH